MGREIPGFFPTPAKLIDLMIACADIGPDVRTILEPSAGKGDIAEAARRAAPHARVVCCEIDSELREILYLRGLELVGRDFMASMGDEAAEPLGPVDVILMNPPFEKGQDIQHVARAFGLLREGGRLVAIMSEGPCCRQDSKATAFREWLVSEPEWCHTRTLPPDSFAGADSFRQTGVNVMLVVLDKGKPERFRSCVEWREAIHGLGGAERPDAGGKSQEVGYLWRVSAQDPFRIRAGDFVLLWKQARAH